MTRVLWAMMLWIGVASAADITVTIDNTAPRRDETGAIIDDPAVRTEFVKLGLTPVQSPAPNELKRFIETEITRWGRIVKQADLMGLQ